MHASLRSQLIRLAHANPVLRAHILGMLKAARMPPPGVRDTAVTSKDTMRIRDMATKSRDQAHMQQLARTMAKAIKDADKAYRRGAAAERLGYHDIADIFYNRADELAGGPATGGPKPGPSPDPKGDAAARARAKAEAEAKARAEAEARAKAERARAEAEARARAERARAEAEARARAEAERARQRDRSPDGQFSRAKILERLQSAQKLLEGATTPGEAAAAAAAVARLKLRLQTMRLAHARPDLRPHLLPLLRSTSDS